MEPKITIPQVSIKFGLITGFLMIILALILNFTNLSTNWWLSLIASLIITIGGMVMAMNSFKKEHLGYLEYKQGLAIGTIVVVISRTLHQIFNFIYINYIDDSSIPAALEKSREMLEKFGMEEDKIDEAIVQAEQSMTSPMSIFWGILWAIFFGFIVSLIVAAIMQKKRSDADIFNAR